MDTFDDDDDFYGSAPTQGGAGDPLVNTEYTRMQQRYTDAGYREGITDGKLATLQEGFDVSFAASVPAARTLGQLRGRANALLAIATPAGGSSTKSGAAVSLRARRSSPAPAATSPASAADGDALVTDIHTLLTALSSIKRNDILPPDLERHEHDRDAHGDLDAEDGGEQLDITPQREMEGLESALAGMGSSGAQAGSVDPMAAYAGVPLGPAGERVREGRLLEILAARVSELERRVLGRVVA